MALRLVLHIKERTRIRAGSLVAIAAWNRIGQTDGIMTCYRAQREWGKSELIHGKVLMHILIVTNRHLSHILRYSNGDSNPLPPVA